MLDVLYTIGMVRDSHRPAEDAGLRSGIETRRSLDLLTTDTTFPDDLFPARPVDDLYQFLPTLGMMEDECVIDGSMFDDGLGQSRQQHRIAADVGLDIQIGYACRTKHASNAAWDLESLEAEFPHGIDDDHLAAASLESHE